MAQTEIYINGYPRSGTAWLTRLLNDILPQDEYVVRRGHFTLKNGSLSAGKFYELEDDGGRKNPKQLSLSNLTDEKLIFLVRDPRDICVSGAWLWQQPVEQFLDRMIAGKVVRCGRWDEYYESMLKFFDNYDPDHKYLSEIYWFTYEGILFHTDTILFISLRALDILFDKNLLDEAVKNQSFTAIKSRIGNDEQALRKAGLRKGIAGDWHNHFTEAMNDKIWLEFGWMMERLGYEK